MNKTKYNQSGVCMAVSRVRNLHFIRKYKYICVLKLIREKFGQK